MSQKTPKLPQMDLAVHGFGYLEENYGKVHFGFSEIPPEVPTCDAFLMNLGLLFRILTSEFISDLFWIVSRIFNVPSLRPIFLMYLWLTSDFPKCRTTVMVIVVLT